MIIVTGGAGFIGSALVWKLNQAGRDDILVVDRLGTGGKWQNLAKRRILSVMHKSELLDWLRSDGQRANINAIFHLGASSATTEADSDYLMENNTNYTRALWQFCTQHQVPFVYASSAATYGSGSHGYRDDAETIPRLRTLNPYGFSKQLFDCWALQQHEQPPFWAGLKFFNVYGPQEYHKGSQSSVIFQFVPQIKKTSAIRLFKSYREGIAHGEQKRDFVYVKDCVNAMWSLYEDRQKGRSGIYNIGSGEARSFADVARAVFKAMGIENGQLEFIDMPEALRAHYQYFTEADLTNLREKGGYTTPFTRLEEGVKDYVCQYLLAEDPYL